MDRSRRSRSHGTPAAAAPSSTSLSFARPAWPVSLPATSGSTWRSTSSLPPVISERRSTSRACSGVAPAAETISSATASGADLAELVQRSEHGRGAVGQTEPFQQARQDHAVVEPNGEIAEADRPHEVVDHQGGFDVGGRRAGADGVEIALHKLAKTAALGVLAPPHRGDVVALEGDAQFVEVFGGEAGQRHRQVEPQPHPTPPVVLKLVELLVGLLAPLAGQDFKVLQAGVSIGLKP